MKSLALGSLSAVALLCTLASGAHATTVAQTTSATPTANIQQTPPMTLVRLAQNGYLSQQGIPSGGDLLYAIQAQQLTPEDLVQAGIRAGQIAPATLQDEGYLNVVAAQLHDLAIFNDSSPIEN